MTWELPRIRVRVALSLGPNDTPTDPDWTDLSDRVRGYRDERGRTDVLQQFGPGTAEVLLDNTDRLLDPANTDGLLYDGTDRIGLPLCPVKVTLLYKGDEYDKFTGFLGPEGWPVQAAPYGPESTVVLNVIDALGHSPNLPPDMWGLGVAALHPDWWSRMDDIGFPVLDDGSEVPNSIGTGHGTIEGTTGISRPFSSGTRPQGGGVNDPGLLLSGDHQLRFPAADLMPDGDQDKASLFMWWSARTAISSGDQAWVLKFVHPLTGIHRLSVYIDGDDGLAYVTTFDASETVVDTDVIDPSAGGYSRFDDGSEHMVAVRWDAGTDNNVTVWMGGFSVTLAIPGDLYVSDLLLGPAPVDVLVDEVAFWRRALDITNDIEPVFMAGGFGMMWGGDTWGDRLGHWIDASGREVTGDDALAWHLPSDTSPALWGLIHPDRPAFDGSVGNYSTTLPATLAEAYQITADSAGGARWATKDGYLRWRAAASLTDSTWAAYYATPVTFTDGTGTDTPGTYRHAGVETTGERIDRVVNVATCTILYSPTPPAPYTASPMTMVSRDEASIARYGERRDDRRSEWCDWTLNQALVEQETDRFAQPHQEFDAVHLDPLNDENLTDWLVETCDLEQACTVVYTSRRTGDTDLVTTVEGLNIQHIAWDWTPQRLLVDLVVAKS